jgi:hypothetical protein
MAAGPSMTGLPFFSHELVGVERTLVAPSLPGAVMGAIQRDWRDPDLQDQTKWLPHVLKRTIEPSIPQVVVSCAW